MEKRLIVIIEDDPIQAAHREAIVKLDKRLKNFYCKKYTSYEKAIEDMKTILKASLVLVDINLSDSNTLPQVSSEYRTGGLELVKKIHESDDTIPIIYTTAYGEEFIPDLGFNGLLSKPITREALVNAIVLKLYQQKLYKTNKKSTKVILEEIEFSRQVDGEIQVETVKVTDILMVESAGGKLKAHAAKKVYISTHKMRKVDDFISKTRGNGIEKIADGFCLNIRKFEKYEIGITTKQEGKTYQNIRLYFQKEKIIIEKLFNRRNIPTISNKLNTYLDKKRRQFLS